MVLKQENSNKTLETTQWEIPQTSVPNLTRLVISLSFKKNKNRFKTEEQKTAFYLVEGWLQKRVSGMSQPVSQIHGSAKKRKLQSVPLRFQFTFIDIAKRIYHFIIAFNLAYFGFCCCNHHKKNKKNT